MCSALTFEGRGAEARIVPTHGDSWLDTECELCGGCLSVCPTGAIYEKFTTGAPPGHEQALEKTKTTCTFCGVGCQIDLNVDPQTKRIVKVTSEPEYQPNEGNLCVKGRFAFNFVHHPDRLTEPLVRGEDGELHPTDWDTALADRGERATPRDEGARHAGGRRARVGQADERGELPHPEARADGVAHELRPLLRSHLTRSDPLRPGQVVRQRSEHQLHPGDRERALPVRDRLEHDRGAPGARAADEEGGAKRRDARRRRPAEDLADEDREAASAAAPGLGRLADQRDDARDPRGGARERGVHPRVHGRLRRGARGRRRATRPRRRKRSPASRRRTSGRRPASTRQSGTPRSSTRSASPSMRAASTTSGRSRTSC